MSLASTPRTRSFFTFVVFAALLITSPSLSLAQSDLSQRPLDHKDYDVWNTITATNLSRDGKWVLYGVNSGKADSQATLKIRSTSSPKEYVIPRGSGAQFSHDSQFAIYRISPDREKLEQLRKAKAKPDQLPKTKLQILELASGKLQTVNGIQSFSMPEKNSEWIAYTIQSPSDSDKATQKTSTVNETYEVTPEGLKRPEKKLKLKKRESESEKAMKAAAKKKEEAKKAKPKKTSESTAENKDEKSKDGEKKTKSAGTTMVLQDLGSGVQQTFPFVTRFTFSEDGKKLAFVTSVKSDGKKKAATPDKKDEKKNKKKDADETDEDPTDGVHVIDLDSLKHTQIITGEGQYRGLTFDKPGTQLAFTTDRDDYETKTSTWALYHWKTKAKEATKIATEGDDGIPAGWWIAPNSGQRFSEDNRRLYFDTAPVPEEVAKQRKEKNAKKSAKKDDEDDDKAKLDVWHWQDPQLQPQQLLQARAERNRDYRAAYNLKSKKIVQLATQEIPQVSIDYRSQSTMAVASSNLPYRKMMSWDVPGFQDAYLVNLDTGKSEKILERVKWNARMSPEGKYITWFDAEQRKWFAKSTSGAGKMSADPIEISAGIEHPLQNELHDTPSLPRAYGSAGWTADDKAMLIYDRFDIWQVDPSGKEPAVCVTAGMGRENQTRYRYQRLDIEERSIDLSKPVVLSAFDHADKSSGYSMLNPPKMEDEKKDKKSAASKMKKDDDEKMAEADSADSNPVTQLIHLDERISGLRKAENSDKVIFNRSTFQMCPDLWSSDLKFKKIHRISDINPQQDQYSWGTAELVHWDASDGQKLDGILYKPDGFDPAKKYPMMVYFYERNSDNLHAYQTPAPGRSIICHSFYVSRGYLVFVPDIPYKTGEPGPSAANAILPGVKHLINQGFVNEKKIGMQGHSWGGYQTAYLVTQTDMFACAESGAPVSNMTSAYGGIRWGSGMSRMFQYERTQSRIGEDLWKARQKYIANSPVFFADKINTPLLILHNDEDGAVPWYQGIELFVALRRLEKPAWMLNYNGNPHWVMGQPNRRDFAIRMQQFFDHYLMDAPEPEWMAVGVPAVDKGKKFGLDLLEPEKEPKEESESEETEMEEGTGETSKPEGS